MRKILRVSALVLALCYPAFAGDMPCPTVVQPPPAPAPQQATEGDIQNPQASNDPLTETMLTLISGVLALL